MVRPEVWRLVDHDGSTLADLVVTDHDFPWLRARVESTGGFDRVRDLFEDEIRLLNAQPEDWDAWGRAEAAIRGAVRLVDPQGTSVPEFLLHIEGTDAWWRWSDEPFPPA